MPTNLVTDVLELCGLILLVLAAGTLAVALTPPRFDAPAAGLTSGLGLIAISALLSARSTHETCAKDRP